MMNTGWRANSYMDGFPEWSSEFTAKKTKVTNTNELIFNAHNLDLRKADVVLGIVKRTNEKGLSVFLHSAEGFEGIVSAPDQWDPELACLPFNTIYVDQFGGPARLYASGNKNVVRHLSDFDTDIATKTLTEAAMQAFPIQNPSM